MTCHTYHSGTLRYKSNLIRKYLSSVIENIPNEAERKTSGRKLTYSK